MAPSDGNVTLRCFVCLSACSCFGLILGVVVLIWNAVSFTPSVWLPWVVRGQKKFTVDFHVVGTGMNGGWPFFAPAGRGWAKFETFNTGNFKHVNFLNNFVCFELFLATCFSNQEWFSTLSGTDPEEYAIHLQVIKFKGEEAVFNARSGVRDIGSYYGKDLGLELSHVGTMGLRNSSEQEFRSMWGESYFDGTYTFQSAFDTWVYDYEEEVLAPHRFPTFDFLLGIGCVLTICGLCGMMAGFASWYRGYPKADVMQT